MIDINKKKENGIIFIGMSGSGKTTIGKMLAKRINYSFVDSDRLIEQHAGQIPLQEIVDSYPDKKDFLKMEKEIISNIPLNKTILATGGSACYAGDTLLKLGGLIIFLDISWDLLLERLGDFSERGVILLESDMKKEYQVRIEKYQRIADLSIDCNNKTKEMILDEIISKL